MTVIAIDGPAGAGKSTVASRLAERLGIEVLDTGAMYRSVCFAAIEQGVDLGDAEAVAQVASQLHLVMERGRIWVNGSEATRHIRQPNVNAGVSTVAANSLVRTQLRRLQREWMSQHGSGIVEGRDIGTEVFPDAEVKVFLVADPRIRAERRAAESGQDVSASLENIEHRDRVDSTRDDSPLRPAEDSVCIDSSTMSIDDVVDTIVRLVP